MQLNTVLECKIFVGWNFEIYKARFVTFDTLSLFLETAWPLPVSLTMLLFFRRRSLQRFSFFVFLFLFFKYVFFPTKPHQISTPRQIQRHNFIERATRSDRSLNVQRHPFLQSRIGRDEKPDVFSAWITNGIRDYWERFQLP